MGDELDGLVYQLLYYTMSSEEDRDNYILSFRLLLVSQGSELNKSQIENLYTRSKRALPTEEALVLYRTLVSETTAMPLWILEELYGSSKNLTGSASLEVHNQAQALSREICKQPSFALKRAKELGLDLNMPIDWLIELIQD